MALTVGSLFAGIGGFDLGLERAGMRAVWQSEIDPYASAVLRKHWPSVPNHGDIRGITGESVERVDVLCGGFPCQDISNAGKRAGIDGERSGLWSEYARVIGELRPRYVIVENVAALLGRGLERVLGDLAALGFDAEWHCIPASAVGAPHRRDRIWIVAYASSQQAHLQCERPGEPCGLARQPLGAGPEASRQEDRTSGHDDASRLCASCAHVADTDQPRLEGRLRASLRECAGEADRLGMRGASDIADFWLVEPGVGRVANGVPRRVDRLRCLGNAIVPQIAEIIGRAIIAAEMRAA